VRLLEDGEFLAGRFDTHFLARDRASALLEPLVGGDELRACALAAALAAQADRREAARVQASIPSGWRNNATRGQLVEYATGEATLAVEYLLDRAGQLAAVAVDGVPLAGARLLRVTASTVALELGGVRRSYEVRRAGSAVHLSGPAGQVDLHELPRYPDPSAQAAAGSLLAPMPGSVIRVDVAEGDNVTAGQPLLVLEAMKMEHEIVAPADGTVSALRVSVGDQVDAGALLAAIDETAIEEAA
jgi:propionyl-CoA carboxylase alpha chain